jgi:hypothetical protein
MSATSDFDTAEGLYDEIDGLRAMLAIREQQVGKLMVAARAVVARASYRADGVLIECDCPTGEIGTINAGMIIDHTPQDCSVIALAALLGDEK